ncbi:MAG: histidine kinase [Acidobacteria bacterium]|nr:MAG: histidine kinase [Acidobacteriota bacterium]
MEERLQAPGPKQTVNVLLVDDQPEGLLALEALLEGPERNIVKTRSGREALRQLLKADFALILLDVQMPDMDGFQTAELIRQRDSSKNTPIIFLTAGHKSEENIFRGYAVGAVDYVLKPIVPEILRSKVSVFVDLARQTELVRRQADQLRQSEQEALQLAQARANLLAELEAANRELEAFAYSVSHDLRAPLRRINGFAGILLEDFSAQLDPVAKGYLERVSQAGRHMCQLLDDLLNLSRVTRKELTRRRTDLDSLVKEVRDSLQPEIEGREIEWQIGCLPTVECDPGLIKQVFANLLLNAIKYTRPRQRATIQVDQMICDGQPAVFVRDNGVGFDMKYADKLFGVFQRLHRQEDFEGTGVGLATVQRIIHKHGGRVWAEAEPYKGATFYFILGTPERNEFENNTTLRGEVWQPTR